MVNDSYAVIFSVPCPYPIDGTCPVGDGDYSNDIMLDGIPSDGTTPIVVAETTNGEASVTLNSGNRPGIVTMRVQLCEIENVNDEGVCSDIIYEADRIVAAIALVQLHMDRLLQVGQKQIVQEVAYFQYLSLRHFGMNGQILLLIQQSVYWYINPEYIASVDPDSKIGNCGLVAWSSVHKRILYFRRNI